MASPIRALLHQERANLDSFLHDPWLTPPNSISPTLFGNAFLDLEPELNFLSAGIEDGTDFLTSIDPTRSPSQDCTPFLSPVDPLLSYPESPTLVSSHDINVPLQKTATSVISKLGKWTPTFNWSDHTTNIAHSDFFRQDLGIGVHHRMPKLMNKDLMKAQANLEAWTKITSTATSDDESSPSSIDVEESITRVSSILDALEKHDRVGTSPSAPLPTTISSPRIAKPSSRTLNRTTPVSVSSPAPESVSSPRQHPARVHPSPKEFHFVSNADKKTATRIRNTIASRSHRDSKLKRIAQLEKEVEMWKSRAEKAERKAR